MSNRSTAIIILAAGNSSRLGYPKQLLEYEGRSLLQISIDAADLCEADSKILVLGANHEDIVNTIDLKSVKLTVNQEWGLGMSKSLEVALRQLLNQDPALDQVLVLLCDQPYVTSSLLNAMIATQATTGKGIVACKYQETLGVPVLFEKKYFNELLDLSGNMGAKKLVYKHNDDLSTVFFPEGKIDIDTKEDYDRLLGK
ncbi:MAG TPA: nucleotidyltransferase family protein [Anditalea sp.]|nr:nucleotidyltransferase family protein [Anditalea sp.]